MSTLKIKNVVSVKNNQDWMDLKDSDNKEFVDIDNNQYFGYRSMENGAKHIMFEPLEVDNLVRLIKDSKKFDSKLILVYDFNNHPSKTNEEFGKVVVKSVNEIVKLESNNLLINIINTEDNYIETIINEMYGVEEIKRA